MSTPIPPPDQTPLWRRLLAILLLAVWPVVGFILLLGSAAEESNLLGQGFATLVEAPWWVATGACMALVSATLFALPASLRVAGRFCHRSKFARPDDGLGRRPRDSNTRGRHPALGLPVVQRRRRYSRCRPHRAGAAGAPPTAGRKRGIEPRPAD